MPSFPIPAWTRYDWHEEFGRDCIHPDDLEAMRELQPYGKVFECLGEDGNYLRLRYRTKSYRVAVRADLMSAVSAPAFSFGDHVSFPKGGIQREGFVFDILWHFERLEPFFHIVVNGKLVSKRYWSFELTAIP